MERIAIFAALQWECRPVLRNLRQVIRARGEHFTVWRAALREREVWVVKTGMGMQQAAVAARAVSETGRFALFLSTGCAGALAPELAPGDLTVATCIVGDASDGRFETDAPQRAHVRRVADGAGLRVTEGPVLCSPHMLASVDAKRTAAVRGSVAVEMEGAAIAACAAETGIPFVSVRAILDTADTELRHAGKFIDPRSGAVRPLALASYLAMHPGALPDLLAMQRMMKAAQASLETFFAAWFGAAL